MLRYPVSVLLMLSLALTFAAEAEAGVLGKKKKGLKGRYLEYSDSADFASYRGALIVLDAAEIVSDKDRPVDSEAVRSTSDEMLRSELDGLRLFGDVVAQMPLEPPADQPIVRVSTKLTLQHGSQAMRFFVGGGAGKSKLHIVIELTDVRSGSRLGTFNGYGTGAGFFSFSGGGVQRMARDDLQENYDAFSGYLRQLVSGE
ncbi:MAG: DUF4410 domain-containing protein [Acidobacteriota bacterium]